MTDASPATSPSPPRRSWFRFSLRTMLLAVHLESLKNLDLLILIGTSVTPAGGKQLQSKLPAAKVGY